MKIAIIGSGISGLVASYLLKQKHEITLFEKNDYLGGHTATIELPEPHPPVVDTGFIVFNDRTYPNFIAFIKQLGVAYQATQMSFSVCNRSNGLQYNGHTLATLFADKRNLLNIRFYHLLLTIMKFNRQAKQAYEKGHIDRHMTLGEFLDRHGYNHYFRQNYLMAMGAAIWSSSLDKMEQFPALLFVKFCRNHGLLDLIHRPQWYVIQGGSYQYVKAWQKACAERVNIRGGAVKVVRHRQGISVHTQDDVSDFDKVIFACHADEVLALLGAGASSNERWVLGRIPFQDNEVVLHTDTQRLPPQRQAWASWNYMIDDAGAELATLTYNMNLLQGFNAAQTYCVSLNQTDRIDEQKLLRRFNYAHPVFNQHSFAAQGERNLIQGELHSYFCGAYWYNGFHEDGVRSAQDVAVLLGAKPLLAEAH